jgi:hypothetical protein
MQRYYHLGFLWRAKEVAVVDEVRCFGSFCCFLLRAVSDRLKVTGRFIHVHVLSAVWSRVRDSSLRGSAKDEFDLRMVGVMDLFNLSSALEI